MKPLVTDIDVDFALLHITTTEAEAPGQLIQEFCDDYSPGDCRGFLNKLVTSALIYDESYNNTANRENLLVWAERFERFVEANYAQQQIIQTAALWKSS